MRVRPIPVPGQWTLHSYYTLSPYAPDGSGRLLASGADLDDGNAEVLILAPDGEVLDRFGEHRVDGSFWHTGWWQTWSPDARFVYYQAGSLKEPKIARRELATGAEIVVEGDLEGAPPGKAPVLSGLLGMLYAAGYGDNHYKPDQAPVPFQARDKHGIFRYDMESQSRELVLSISDILEQHPQRDKLLASDAARDGLTLMAYCVRWSPDASKFLFYFGNHCTVPERGEPRLAYIMTANADLSDLRLALDLSYGRPGVHWSWQPDNERLVGYGPHPDDPSRMCLAEVNYDGSGYRWLSDHRSGGHPSVSHVDTDLIVTDEGTPDGGAVVFISRRTGGEIDRVALPKFRGDHEPAGRNELRVCHHPVWSPSGDHVLCNTLPGRDAVLAEVAVPQ